MKNVIAFAEDEETLLKIYTLKLEKAGYKVHGFKDGLSIVNWLSDNTANLVILDINMPEMNGYEVLKVIHNNFADQNKSHIPIIVFSNLNDRADVEKAMSLGAKDFVKKVDSTPEGLLYKVKMFLN
jgi:DNA-binding response OmpR family regulator